jgi:hypothetical protein
VGLHGGDGGDGGGVFCANAKCSGPGAWRVLLHVDLSATLVLISHGSTSVATAVVPVVVAYAGVLP